MPSREGGDKPDFVNADGALTQKPAVEYGDKIAAFFKVTEES
jgi:hypothetical protein